MDCQLQLKLSRTRLQHQNKTASIQVDRMGQDENDSKECYLNWFKIVVGCLLICILFDMFNNLLYSSQLISCWFSCRVHGGRNSCQIREYPQFSTERILCIASSRKRPVIKWENNMAWPGKVTLTDTALYFEVFLLSTWLLSNVGAQESFSCSTKKLGVHNNNQLTIFPLSIPKIFTTNVRIILFINENNIVFNLFSAESLLFRWHK